MTGAIKHALAAASAAALLAPGAGFAADITFPVFRIGDQGVGEKIGAVRAFDTKNGLRLAPRLAGLPPGEHGFHVHEKADCGPAGANNQRGPGLAAGGHYDPEGAKQHAGPKGRGHKGDLPSLTVAADGAARTSVIADRLKVEDLRGRALMIHAGGDNYADQPQPLGGGGARIACATIPR